MKLLCEKMVNTERYAGTVDLITGLEDFKTNIQFDREWHTYRVNNKIIPSVTQLLDDGTYDKSKIAREILRYAQDKGILIHQEIQEWLEKGKEGITEEFYEFVRLFNENQKLFLQKAIFDFKTYAVASLKNRRKCYQQIDMYSKAIKYLTSEEIKNYYLVHLPHGKEGKIYDLAKEFESRKEEK